MFEFGEEEVPLVEVSEEMFPDAILFLKCGSSMIIVRELEVTRMNLEEAAGLEQMVILAEDLSFWQLLDHEWISLHSWSYSINLKKQE